MNIHPVSFTGEVNKLRISRLKNPLKKSNTPVLYSGNENNPMIYEKDKHYKLENNGKMQTVQLLGYHYYKNDGKKNKKYPDNTVIINYRKNDSTLVETLAGTKNCKTRIYNGMELTCMSRELELKNKERIPVKKYSELLNAINEIYDTDREFRLICNA